MIIRSLLQTLLVVFVFGACHQPPEISCDRVRFGWPAFQLNEQLDESDQEGIQISFDVRSDLQPGAKATLSVKIANAEGESETNKVGEAIADSEQLLAFKNITVPLGSVVFLIDAEDECGKARTGKRTYIWDGGGKPACQLTLRKEPIRASDGTIPTLGIEYDEDLALPGIQVHVQLNMERPDLNASLFIVNRESGKMQDFELEASETGLVTLDVTLLEGEQAMRAICHWPKEEFHLTTPTKVYQVQLAE